MQIFSFPETATALAMAASRCPHKIGPGQRTWARRSNEATRVAAQRGIRVAYRDLPNRTIGDNEAWSCLDATITKVTKL